MVEISWKKVNWNEIKRSAETKGYSYNDLPFSFIEKQAWQDECETAELKPGQLFVRPTEHIPGIYVLLDGRVGIGEKKDDYLVERMAIEPFSLLGEAEAPMTIGEKEFPHNFPQQWAWVTSDTLSRLIAFRTEPYILKKVPGSGWTLEFLQKHYDDSLAGDERDYTIKAESLLFTTKNNTAKIFKIPLQHIEALWTNNKCREWLCHDAFIKSKKFLLVPCHDDDMSNAKDASQQIVALYNYAKMNGYLVNDVLYILGQERLKAILSTSLKIDVKGMEALCEEVKKRHFQIDIVKKISVKKGEADKNIPIDELLIAYKFMSRGSGGNSNLFKIHKS